MASKPYTILADYSNDLAALKKRDGMLPADYAAAAIEAYANDRVVAELELLKKLHAAQVSLGAAISIRIAELTNGLTKNPPKQDG